jgi:hypothetical protein
MHRIPNAPRLLVASFAIIGVFATVAAQAVGRDVADIRVQSNGAEQRVEVDMNRLREGQSLQLSTESGLPAIVTRTADGLSLEVAGETHQIHLPAVEVIDLGGTASDRHIVIKRQAHTQAERAHREHQVRVIHRSHDEAMEGELDEARIEALVAEAMAEAEAARASAEIARGEALEAEERAHKVRVIRRIERDRADKDG